MSVKAGDTRSKRYFEQGAGSSKAHFVKQLPRSALKLESLSIAAKTANGAICYLLCHKRTRPQHLDNVVSKLPNGGTSTQQYDSVLAEQKKTLT